MNIFLLEQDKNGNIDWRKSAESLDNMRIVKMILESMQMLSTVYQQYQKVDGLYRPTHINHPCTKWVGESLENFSLTIEHAIYMNETFKKRFDKSHRSIELLKLFDKRNYRHFFSNKKFTIPPLAMPDEFRGDNVVESYQNYFVSKDLIKYNREDIPKWFLEKREKPFMVRINNQMKYRQIEVVR